jgi:hypothetical protein
VGVNVELWGTHVECKSDQKLSSRNLASTRRIALHCADSQSQLSHRVGDVSKSCAIMEPLWPSGALRRSGAIEAGQELATAYESPKARVSNY